MRRVVLLFVGLLALASVTVASSGGATQAQQRWVITDLGTGEAVAINESGQIVGSTRGKAALWKDGTVRNLGVLPGPYWSASEATGINDHSQVVGFSYTTDEENFRNSNQAIRWLNGRVQALPTPRDSLSEARGINDRGQIVGWSQDRGDQRATLWVDGRRQLLATPGSHSEATAINDNGQVVGEFCRVTHDGFPCWGFTWQAGKSRSLGSLGEGKILGDQDDISALNDKGQIVGWSFAANGVKHAVLWTLKR